MYLSCLLIDVGTNPDRPRPGRLWLRNRYRVHQRLCMAFPSGTRKQRDPLFLEPFASEDRSHVHVMRTDTQAFLFRVDPQPGGRVMVLVQSALMPDWEYAFQNANDLLAVSPSVKPFALDLERGQRCYFKLEANPTKRLCRASRNTEGAPVAARWVSKRVPVTPNNWYNWLERRAERNGFQLCEIATIRAGYVYFTKATTRGEGQRLRSVRYDGTLQVIDQDRFREAFISGIGPAKAFGFGLLSIAPVR